jgi:hypothetical protein
MRCVAHFKSVNWQYPEYLALKYLVLFDPGKFKLMHKKFIFIYYAFISLTSYTIFVNLDVSGISNSDSIEEVQQHISSALVEFTTMSGVPEKFAQLLLKLPDIKLIGVEIKQLLTTIDTHIFSGSLLDGCLLGEMLYGPTTLAQQQ